MVTVYQAPSPENQPDQSPFVQPKPRKRIFGLIGTIGLFLTGLTGAFIFFSQQTDLVSPLGSNLQSILGFSVSKREQPKIVYGFIPYWNFKYQDEIQYQHLTHLALFGLSYDTEGNIVTREQNYAEPGYRNLEINSSTMIRQAKEAGVKVILTITAFENKSIEAIIQDKSARENFIDQTIDFVQAKNFDGVNFDFEYIGDADQTMRDGFTDVVKELGQALKAVNPDYHYSIDVYADSANNNRIWQIDEIGQHVDHIIIMAYDFHRPSSAIAGPVAPLYGGDGMWKHDITGLMSQHLTQNSPEKLLLGVPFYGYQWRTESEASGSPTFKRTGHLATYRRVQKLINDDEIDVQVNWSQPALSPWLSFEEDGTYQQIYYDNTTSLGYKFDYVNQADLAGIAIWALGYEGDSPEIWDVVERRLQGNN